MFEISSLSPVCPVIKPEKIKKDDHSSEQPQHKKKQAPAEQETQPVRHIDEIV
jgi:hypothetical protein